MNKKTMNKILSILVVFIILFSSVGCTTSDAGVSTNLQVVSKTNLKNKSIKKKAKEHSNLDKKAIATKMKKQLNEIHSTQVLYNISSQVEKENPVDYETMAKVIYDKKDPQKIKEIYNQTKVGEQITSSMVYMDKKRGFVNEGKGFEEIIIDKNSNMEINTDSEYKKTVEMMIFAMDSLDLKEDKNYYYLSFAGKNGDLMYKLDGLFGLGINLMELDKIDFKADYTIRKADMILVSAVHESKELYENENYTFVGKMYLDSYNTFDKIDEAKDIKPENKKTEDKK